MNVILQNVGKSLIAGANNDLFIGETLTLCWSFVAPYRRIKKIVEPTFHSAIRHTVQNGTKYAKHIIGLQRSTKSATSVSDEGRRSSTRENESGP